MRGEAIRHEDADAIRSGAIALTVAAAVVIALAVAWLIATLSVPWRDGSGFGDIASLVLVFAGPTVGLAAIAAFQARRAYRELSRRRLLYGAVLLVLALVWLLPWTPLAFGAGGE